MLSVALKPTMYCTAQDVRSHNQTLSKSVITDEQLEVFIYRATAQVNMELLPIYDLTQFNESATLVGIPTPKDDANEGAGNIGTASLLGASAGADLPTQMFTLVCATSTFSVKSSVLGLIGSGTYTTNFVSTNRLSIPKEAWYGTPASGDEFYISVYKQCQPIVFITSMLAAGLAMASKYTEDVPNSNFYANKLTSYAVSLLNKLKDPTNSILTAGSRWTWDIDPVANPYSVNYEGEDVTPTYPDRPTQEDGEDDGSWT